MEGQRSPVSPQEHAWSGALRDALAHSDLDSAFGQLAAAIERRLPLLQRQLQVRMRAWLAKLAEETANITWKKNRNAHARLLLEQLRAGALREPFDALPPQGRLNSLSPHLAVLVSAARTSGSARRRSPGPLDEPAGGATPSCSAQPGGRATALAGRTPGSAASAAAQPLPGTAVLPIGAEAQRLDWRELQDVGWMARRLRAQGPLAARQAELEARLQRAEAALAEQQARQTREGEDEGKGEGEEERGERRTGTGEGCSSSKGPRQWPAASQSRDAGPAGRQRQPSRAEVDGLLARAQRGAAADGPFGHSGSALEDGFERLRRGNAQLQAWLADGSRAAASPAAAAADGLGALRLFDGLPDPPVFAARPAASAPLPLRAADESSSGPHEVRRSAPARPPAPRHTLKSSAAAAAAAARRAASAGPSTGPQPPGRFKLAAALLRKLPRAGGAAASGAAAGAVAAAGRAEDVLGLAGLKQRLQASLREMEQASASRPAVPLRGYVGSPAALAPAQQQERPGGLPAAAAAAGLLEADAAPLALEAVLSEARELRRQIAAVVGGPAGG